MKDRLDDVIDGLVREQFNGPVLDDGFCERVMGQIPARRRRNNWPLAAGFLAGLLACWANLWSASITYVGWQDWLTGELSVSVIALFLSMALMAILALTWIIAEADDQ